MSTPTWRRLVAGHLLAAHVLAAVLVVVAGLLGWWQLQAWQDRRAAEARDLTELDPVALPTVLGPDDPFPARDVGRPVTVSGRWLPEGTFHVAGREHDGHTGYWVVTPLDVGDAAVLVVRGWSPEPAAPAATGAAEVTGWLQPPEGRVGLTDEDPTDDVLPQLRIADAVQRVDVDLYGAYVVQDPARSPLGPGLAPADLAALPEAGRFTALRNLLYALEWWFFGTFAAFIWWRHVRDQLAAARAAEQYDAAEPRPTGVLLGSEEGAGSPTRARDGRPG